MTMKSPSHPGVLIRREVIEPLGLSVTAAARALGDRSVGQASGGVGGLAAPLAAIAGPHRSMGGSMWYALPNAPNHADPRTRDLSRQTCPVRQAT